MYRFSASLYYANAERLSEETRGLVGDGGSGVRWLGMDAAAMSDVDFSGGQTIRDIHGELTERGVRLVFVGVIDAVRAQLDRYGVTDLIGTDAYFTDVGGLIDAFEASPSNPAGSPT